MYIIPKLRLPLPSLGQLASVGAVLLLAVPLSAAQATQEPDLSYYRANGSAIWVSAEAADRDGEIRWELFDQYARADIESERERIRAEITRRGETEIPRSREDSPYLPEDLCTATSFDVHVDEVPPRDSFQALRRHALGIFQGRVVAITQGFLSGNPASVLTVEIDETIRQSVEFTAGETLLVGYPYAAFAIGSDVFCSSDPRYDYRPTIGDRVFLFPHRGTVDEEYRLLIPEPEEILAATADGELLLPEKLAKDPFLKSNPGVSRIREVLVIREQTSTRGSAAP